MRNLITAAICAGALSTVLGMLVRVFTDHVKLFGVKGISYDRIRNGLFVVCHYFRTLSKRIIIPAISIFTLQILFSPYIFCRLLLNAGLPRN